LIVEKRKTDPTLQADNKFYPTMLGYLLKHILEWHDLNAYKEVIVFTDRLPINKKRKAIEKAVKQTLSEMIPVTATYRVLHHESKSNIDLQIADYFTWAIWRKWDQGDVRSYDLIKSVVKSEFDIFQTETAYFY